MLRAPVEVGCLVVGSNRANSALLVPPPGERSDFSVPGLATYMPISEYRYPPVASSVWICMYSAKQRARAPLFTGLPATSQVGRLTFFSPACLTSGLIP